MSYKSVYRFLVFDEIKRGETVYCLDKEMKTVHNINDMSVEAAIALLNIADVDSVRFEFWEDVKEESKNA
jgi:hypothetical protein